MRRRVGSFVVLAALAATLLAPASGRAASPVTEYIPMPDKTLIAVNIQFPSATPPEGGWPILIQIDGYGGGSVAMNPNAPVFGAGRYATVHMSLRGTGCSGGKFDLFDRISAMDGYHVIEDLAHRTWASGQVAIWGHSYSGLTGWLVASTQPPSLDAISVSGLIDDLYRGIVYMGGVSNLGFPLIWTGAYRPRADYADGMAPGLTAGDEVCARNQAGRVPPDVLDNAVVNGVGSLGEDDHWWASHSTITYLDAINVPTHIVQSYQDEQTGPRGSNLLWQRLDERKPVLPKRLLLTNGVHSTNTAPAEVHNDRIAFLNCYLGVTACSADILDPNKRVKVLWEMHDTDPMPPTVLASNGVTADRDWPLSVTDWQRFYFQPGGGLATLPPTATNDPDAYVAGSKRVGAWTYLDGARGSNYGAEATTANLPDEVRFTKAFATDTAIAGPIDVSLFASSTAPDTEFYVEMNDVDSKGNVTRLQRGLLKASHRELDPLRTDYNAAGDIIRPYHPHTNTLSKVLTPGVPERFEIEVFPLGHVFRAGHSLMIRITTPPMSDSLAFYIPMTAPAVNRIYHDPTFPSSILLPVVPATSVPSLGPELGCGAQVGLERCSKPVN